MPWLSRVLAIHVMTLSLLMADSVFAQSAARAKNLDAVAVIIGNRDYGGDLPRVLFARNDARAIRAFVTGVLGFRDGNVIELLDASQAQMISVFGNRDDHRGKLWQYVREGRSDVFIFYSGHGVPGLRDKRGYLLPVDADPGTPELNGYPLDQLLANVEKLNARSVTVVVDACFSGNSAGGWLVRSASPVYVKTAPIAQMDGIVLITAAQSDQLASWHESSRLGLFTKHFLDAANGAADGDRFGDANGEVSLGEIKDYLDEEMTYAARRSYGRVQTASISGPLSRVIVPEISPNQAPADPLPIRLPAPPPTSQNPDIPNAADLFRPPKVETYTSADRPKTAAEAAKFLTTNSRDVLLAVRDYYDRSGKIWDTVRVGISLREPERIKRLFNTRLIAPTETGFTFQTDYVFVTSTREISAEAGFRIEFLEDGLKVTSMWR
jgi:hypothetical protein